MKPKYWTITVLFAAAIAAGYLYYMYQPAYDLGQVSVHRSVKTQSPATTTPQVDISSLKAYTNNQYGFSFEYDGSSYLAIDKSDSGLLELRSSKLPVTLGGALPDTGTEGVDWTTQGYTISMEVDSYSQSFDFNKWFADKWNHSELDSKNLIKVGGVDAYEFTVKNEIGAGEPNLVIPYKGKVFLIYDNGGSDKNFNDEALKAYKLIKSTFKFTK